jgi:hypothetical protein
MYGMHAAVDGDRFMAVKLGIQNTAGDEKQQALALRVRGDQAIFFNCRIDGHQDTLFAQAYRQYYRSCIISGTVDFIFGDAAAVFQRCVMLVRDPLPGKPGVVTAHGRRDRQQTTGFVLHRTRIVADDSLASKSATVKTFLGRPWKSASSLLQFPKLRGIPPTRRFPERSRCCKLRQPALPSSPGMAPPRRLEASERRRSPWSKEESGEQGWPAAASSPAGWEQRWSVELLEHVRLVKHNWFQIMLTS